MSKPLVVREYEADRILWMADPVFAEEVGVRGPLPPLFPPLLAVSAWGTEDDWSLTLRWLQTVGYVP